MTFIALYILEFSSISIKLLSLVSRKVLNGTIRFEEELNKRQKNETQGLKKRFFLQQLDCPPGLDHNDQVCDRRPIKRKYQVKKVIRM